jgi:hypothetical protein
MTVAVVIGNGPSRLQFDLTKIKSFATTYGCNAIYRDFTPHYLISMDRYMVDEILKSRIHHDCMFYTQHDNRIDELERTGEPINFVRTTRQTHDSGNTAIELALETHSTVYMIGFDYNDANNDMPNVYAGTGNYANVNNYHSAQSQADKWRQRLRKIISTHNTKSVIRVVPKIEIESNLLQITCEQFKEIYENKLQVS